MIGVVLIAAGGILLYLASTDQIKAVFGIAQKTSLGRRVDLSTYILAAIIVSIPCAILESTGNRREAWAYAFLITLSMLVFYSSEISRFSEFVQSEFSRR